MRLHTAILILALAMPSFAQRGQGGQRGQDAKPMPPIPKLADGTPNLSWSDAANQGVWTPVRRRGNDQQSADQQSAELPQKKRNDDRDQKHETIIQPARVEAFDFREALLHDRQRQRSHV